MLKVPTNFLLNKFATRLFYRDKSTVATRLANAAKNLLYGETQHLTIGPQVYVK